MSKLLTTIEALESALSDTPNTPTAWVPLRRATVEAAYRVLGSIPVAISILGVLDETGEVPNWRAEEANGGQPVFVADEVHVLPGNGSISAKASGNGNGAVTVAPAELLTYTQPAVGNGKAPNMWRRKPKIERLAIVQATIARLAVNGWLTQTQFDQGKPDDMPTATAHVTVFGMSWNDLVRSALAPAEAEVAADEAEPFRG